ncbi:MAG: protein kinase [Planctomycetes bacterium]|nr:protein kinase [Planctomycetota bacterium]
MTMSHAAFLKTVPAFRSLSDSACQHLSSQCEETRFAAGEQIIRRGDPGDAMFIIAEGGVRIPIQNPDGREMLTVRLGPHDFFGEMALLTGEPRNADVFAESDVRCLRIRREPLQLLLKEHTAVAAFLTNILGQRLLEGENIRSVGRYRIAGELGAGGQAFVFEGRHETLGHTVAIKMLSHELIYEAGFVERFKAESRIMAMLRHENIVRVFDYEEAYATFFIVMEKVAGTDLKRLLLSRGVPSAAAARSIISQIAKALDHAHERGIVHRDVKPGNVLIEEGGRVKLMDFGIASSHAEGAGSAEQVILGTPIYMSPEQAMGRATDGRSDIFSLGVLAFELLTGQRPYGTEEALAVLRDPELPTVPPPRAIDPRIPQDLDELVLRATERDPANRFQRAREIVAFLEPHRAAPGETARTRRVTLTLTCDAAEPRRVDAFLRKVRKEAEKIPGARLTVSGGAENGESRAR